MMKPERSAKLFKYLSDPLPPAPSFERDIPWQTWVDLVGVEVQKQTLTERVVNFLQDENQTSAYNGILLTGFAGTGKRSSMYAAINEANRENSPVTFLQVGAVEVNSCYRGGMEKNMQGLFKEAIEKAPTIILVDLADMIIRDGEVGITPEKIEVVAGFLHGIDKLASRPVSSDPVVVAMITDAPRRLDSRITEALSQGTRV